MENSNKDKLVLVTGGSGFIASYCIIDLLNKEFKVRASLPSAGRSTFSYSGKTEKTE